MSEAWMLTAVLVAPPVVWSAWELLQAWRTRIRRARTRRDTWGDGTP